MQIQCCAANRKQCRAALCEQVCQQCCAALCEQFCQQCSAALCGQYVLPFLTENKCPSTSCSLSPEDDRFGRQPC